MSSLKNNLFPGMVFNAIVFAFFGLGFIACDNNRYYEKNEFLGNNTWYYRDAKAFEVEITDSLLAFNFYINPFGNALEIQSDGKILNASVVQRNLEEVPANFDRIPDRCFKSIERILSMAHLYFVPQRLEKWAL